MVLNYCSAYLLTLWAVELLQLLTVRLCEVDALGMIPANAQQAQAPGVINIENYRCGFISAAYNVLNTPEGRVSLQHAFQSVALMPLPQNNVQHNTDLQQW